MSKKVNVNKDVCIGCGLCTGLLPSVFEFDDDGKAKANEVPAEDEGSIADVVAQCPVGAIEEE